MLKRMLGALMVLCLCDMSLSDGYGQERLNDHESMCVTAGMARGALAPRVW